MAEIDTAYKPRLVPTPPHHVCGTQVTVREEFVLISREVYTILVTVCLPTQVFDYTLKITE